MSLNLTKDVAIDLKKLSLQKRNLVMKILKICNSYYKIENQVLEIDFRTASKIFESLNA